MASRHRRSILGSLAVLALLLVVVVAGLIGGDGGRDGAAAAPVGHTVTVQATGPVPSRS